MPFFSKKYKLGLDIGSSLIKVCLPSRSGRPVVLRLDTPPGTVSKGVLQKPEELGDALLQWSHRKQLDHHFVVATLPASTLVLRHIQIPRLKPKETAEAVQWEARRVLPFALEEAQVDWVNQGVIIEDEGEMQNILLVAVRDAVVERYAEAVKLAGFKLISLDIAPMALGRWLLKEPEGTSLIIDFGAETTQMHFYDGTKLIFSRSLSVGGAEATRAVANASGLEFVEAETKKLRGEYREDWLESWNRELGREMQRSLEYFRSNFEQYSGDGFARVLLSGGASLTRGIHSLVSSTTGTEPGYAEFATKERSPRHDKIMYNIALGAGMWEGK